MATSSSVRESSGPSPGEDRAHGRFVWLVIGVAFVVMWVLPLRASFWLDELGTYWVIKDALGDTIDRALTYHGQSPVYYVVAWLAAHLGRSEVVLRLPSLLAAIGAAWLLFVLARTLIDRETARLSVLGFVILQVVAFAATDARPYSLALLAVIACALATVRWVDRPSAGRTVWVALAAAAVVWVHYLFALALIAFALFVVFRIVTRTTELRRGRVMIAIAGAVALSLPLVGQIGSLYGRRGVLSIPGSLGVTEVIGLVLPPLLVGGLVLGALAGRARGRLTFTRVSATEGTTLLLWAWLLIPPAVLLSISVITPLDLYSSRYFLSTAPAAAILFGWGARSIGPEEARRVLAIVSTMLAVLAFAGIRETEDWRAAAATVSAEADPDTIVLFHPAFVESAQLEWFTDPERRSYLMAPASYYPVEGQLVPMPYLAEGDALGYLDRVVEERLDGASRFLLVTRYPWVPYREWLEGRLGPEGWTAQELGSYGTVEVIEFTKGSDERSPT